jgi:hypothetical protein
MTSVRHEATHPKPIWRERADFVIGAPLGLSHHVTSEQLWARRLGELTFEICCIPFHLYDVALGDVVEASPSFDFVRVIKSSGRFTFRVWFSGQTADRSAVAGALEALGAGLEWSGADLLAVDAADEVIAQAVADYLWSDEQAGRLIYETGKTKRDL